MNNPFTRNREDQDADQQSGEPSTEDTDGAPAPFAPDSDDDSPLGDTDEHSDA